MVQSMGSTWGFQPCLPVATGQRTQLFNFRMRLLVVFLTFQPKRDCADSIILQVRWDIATFPNASLVLVNWN